MSLPQSTLEPEDLLAASMAGLGNGSSSSAQSRSAPRFDYYQTDTTVTVSVFAKNVKEEDLKVDVGECKLSVAVRNSDGSESALVVDPLYSTVDTNSSSYKVFSTKIEVTLHKGSPGVRWGSLQGGAGSLASASTPAYSAEDPTRATAPAVAAVTAQASSSGSGNAPSAASPSSAAPRRPANKWDQLDYDELAGAKSAEEESDINAFFQKIYKDANEDTRRAMIKSFQESNGTTLSTNWDEVGKGKVETKPPSGMTPRKYD